MSEKSVMVVLGTRPEAMKLAPVIRRLGAQCEFLYTGQHYDTTLSSNVLADLSLPPADTVLDIGGRHRGNQIGAATEQITERIAASRPRVVVVQGDTNSGLAGALAANASHVPLLHVEAGLRSFDRAMPEEHNRVLMDHLADVCAAPTELNRQNLRRENISEDRIAVTGNTIVESVIELLPSAAARQAELLKLGVSSGRYVIATLHRPENVDRIEVLTSILKELELCRLPVVLPVHPRTRARLDEWSQVSLLNGPGLRVVEPLPPRSFLAFAAEARLWVTDSGGLQEEASILKRRALVVRRSTERPETLGSFSDLVEPDALGDRLAREIDLSHDHLAAIASPFGDGRATDRILEALKNLAS